MRDEERQDLRQRTKRFALEVVRLYARLPKTTVGEVMGRQLLRAGTSIGAHYREACRAKSDADFVSKIETGLQELDETLYWLELLSDAEMTRVGETSSIAAEANELISMFVAMVRGVKARTAR